MITKKPEAKGFTLAEMLITLVIIGIVGAAMIPFFKPARQIGNIFRRDHGIIECYYDNSGNLHQFERYTTSDDPGLREGRDTTVDGSSCNITLPESSYYKVHVIGPGGNGGGYSETQTAPEYTLSEEPVSGQINIGNFKNAISNIKIFENEAIRNLWNNNPPSAYFTLLTGAGNGGYTECAYIQKKPDDEYCKTNCNESTSIPACYTSERDCYTQYVGQGGAAGNRILSVLSSPIYIDDEITIADSKTLIINGTGGERKATITDAGAGTEGRVDTGSTAGFVELPGNKGTDGSISSNSFRTVGSNQSIPSESSPNSCVPGEKTASGSESRDPKIMIGSYRYDSELVANPDNGTIIHYSYSGNTINYPYFTKGENGKSMERYYEKIPSRTLRLTPGQAGVSDSGVEALIGSDYIEIINAARGIDGVPMTEIVAITSEDQLPLPINQSMVVSTNVGNNISQYTALENGLGINNSSSIPGQGGSGLYPLIPVFTYNKSVLTLKGPADNIDKRGESNDEIEFAAEADKLDKCYGNDQNKIEGENFCRAVQGRNGAIIITW